MLQIEPNVRFIVAGSGDLYRRCIELAAELGMSAAALGHRYALSMAGVDTVVLGVKNRAELADCVAAAEAGPLPAEVIARVDGCFPDRG